MLKVDNLQV